MNTIPVNIKYGEGMGPEGYSNQVAAINFFRSRKNPYVAKNSQFKDNLEVLAFLEEMNRNACRLGLRGTFYDSPHGLINFKNMSTAFDQTKLGAICMQNELFAKIVGTRHY